MTKRNNAIDVLKALAIVSVILIHALPDSKLYTILAPYYIWQTVPMFIILFGYNSAQSFMRKGNTTLKDTMTLDYIMNKVKRLLVPFGLIWLLQIIVQLTFYDRDPSLSLLFSFVRGGYGPGSYFIPMIIQASLLVPIIYSVMRVHPTKWMTALFFISLMIDLAAYQLDISGSLYRLLIIRHIFSLTLGVWLGLLKGKIKLKWLIVPALFSFIYITAVHYFNWGMIIEEYWHSQHAPSYFYVLLLVILGMKGLNLNGDSRLSRLFILTGQASYHIFLVQMLYFWLIHDQLTNLPEAISLSLALIVPIITGWGYYLLNKRIAFKPKKLPLTPRPKYKRKTA
ncbi:acyltransferase family protein [Alkalibacterium pelagium]|uniref:Peptidoglycan/LPS O-acetylase OafA/YrhL, contains acyltransferase and SGNH-hydrolase domains n=1 Tax=Alkalibacterium pelagium TaxID=426702 RepID=A0A1H7NLD3_9LACT|nr:acyltransferase [Alkalibacterium pelagium]GEN51446.1 hypothetical protein APE02nite_21110 [Alkalibacterium pelagium]SEL24161.1 Peptidoglycan/LPS O-acetylase OafA/YrhL, contains acyltransferase and SGNH-hydrolase domains [Alkalibacterium pelagium]